MSFLRRQAVIAALTANALRPLTGQRAGIPAFAAGWMYGELAPQVLALTAADTALHLSPLRRGPRSRLGLALAAGSALGLAHLVRQSQRARHHVEDALVEGLGVEYVEQLDAPPTPADLATPWRQLLNPLWMRERRVHVERDIAYSTYGRRGMLDIYRPAEGDLSGAPVLLQVHGGAWMTGRKDRQAIPLMQHMAARGWVCVAINYRLSPRAVFPDHIVDVKRAIAWIKEHIDEYGGDPDYIVITGGSAGGHLCALAAVTPNEAEWQPGFEEVDTTVQAAVPHYGVYDFAGSTGLRSAVGMRDTFLAPRVLRTTWDARAREVRGRLPDPARRRRRARLLRHPRRQRHPGRRGPGPRLRRPAAGGVEAARWCTPSCPVRSTPSTRSRRSAPPTWCARSSATSTGTGTPGARAARSTPVPRPATSRARPPGPDQDWMRPTWLPSASATIATTVAPPTAVAGETTVAPASTRVATAASTSSVAW